MRSIGKDFSRNQIKVECKNSMKPLIFFKTSEPEKPLPDEKLEDKKIAVCLMNLVFSFIPKGSSSFLEALVSIF